MKTRLIIVYLSAMFLLYFLFETIDSADGLNFLYGIAFISILAIYTAFLFHDIDLRDARKKIKEMESKLLGELGKAVIDLEMEMNRLSGKTEAASNSELFKKRMGEIFKELGGKPWK